MTAAADDLAAGLLAFLGERGFDADRLNAFTAHCERMRREMDAGARLTLAERLRVEAPAGDTVRLHSALFLLTGDLWHYERILHYLQLGIERAEPALLHYVLWCIQRQVFLGAADPAGGKAAAFGPCDLHRYYEALVRSIARRWEIRPARGAARPGPVRRVAMMANQFLGESHQPSRDVFDFGRRLRDDHGLEVMLFNPNLMPLQVECVFVPPFLGTLEEGYAGRREAAMFGHRLPMESFPERPFTRDKLARVVAAVERFDPDVIVTFGGGVIAADLFALARARPVVTIPSTNGFTLGLGDRMLGYDGTDWSQGLPAPYRGPFEGRVRPFALGFSLPPLSPAPERLDLPEGAFVFAVVGTRLDHEVDAAFLARVDAILDACPGAVAAFAGGAEALPGRLAAVRNAGRMIALGHVADIRRFYRRAGAFLNPPRQGGGGSAAYALAEGVPVVTLAAGDVAGVAGPEFRTPDPNAYAERARRLFADQDFRAHQAEAAKARFAEACDRAAAVGHLLAHCQEAKDGRDRAAGQ